MDLVYIPGLTNTIDAMWNEPELRAHVARLVSFSRVITLDKRGSGLSARSGRARPPPSSTDGRRAGRHGGRGIGRGRAVRRADGGPLGLVLAASHPDRARGLAVWATSARLLEAPDYQIGLPASLRPAWLEGVRRSWGDPEDDPRYAGPAFAGIHDGR